MSTYDIKRDKYLAETNFLNKLAQFKKKILMYIFENIYVWQLAMNLIWRKKLAALYDLYDT